MGTRDSVENRSMLCTYYYVLLYVTNAFVFRLRVILLFGTAKWGYFSLFDEFINKDSSACPSLPPPPLLHPSILTRPHLPPTLDPNTHTRPH